MSEHTKEPWSISHDAHDGWPLVMAEGKIIANVNLETFDSGVADLIEMPAESNARRIVACVNACAGVSDEALNATGRWARAGQSTLKELHELRQQRDKLLAALKKCVVWAARYGRTDAASDATEALAIIAEIEAEK